MKLAAFGRPLGCLKAAFRQTRQNTAWQRSLATAVTTTSVAPPETPVPKFTVPKKGFLTTRQRDRTVRASRYEVYPQLPSVRTDYHDLMPALRQVQIKTMDPTGARTRLFAKDQPDAAKPGDALMVSTKSGEPFAGILIEIRRRGIGSSILLRGQLMKTSVEMFFKIYSPTVTAINIIWRRPKRARRARLTYMRLPKHDMGNIDHLVQAWRKERSALRANTSRVAVPQQKPQSKSKSKSKRSRGSLYKFRKGPPIKQEPYDFPSPHHQGHFGHQMEQVPMDDILDPLETFSFWDGETFYCHDQRMAVDPSMPPLPEYDDEMTTKDEDDEILRDLRSNPTLAELNSSEFDYSLTNNSSGFFGEDSGYQLELLSKSFQGQLDTGLSSNKSFQPGLDSHFVSSPVPSGSTFGLNYVPSGYIDIKQNVQPSLSSSCPAPSRLQHPPVHLGQQFLESRFPPLCPQNSPASDSSYFGAAVSGGSHQSQVTLDSPSHMAPSSPLRVAQSNRFHQQDSVGLLSSSAPPDVTMATYFRAKVKSEPLSSSPGPRSVTERSLSGFSSLSLSNDDESGSFFDDEDEEDDFSSDEDIYQYESDDPLPNSGATDKPPRRHRYFWQYNLQSRGARAQHILPRSSSSASDPHAPSDPFDPVFHEECALPVKHSGKARRGDGNDLTPDPRKLHGIGVELRALNRAIYCVGVEGAKPLSRKEKNKLASRVCRLKKKAQHEANKIKLYGLQQEHKKLLNILVDTRELLKYKIENLHDKKVSNCSKKLETFLAANDPYKVAGNTATFVNEVLEKVSKGEPDGGLGRL